MGHGNLPRWAWLSLLCALLVACSASPPRSAPLAADHATPKRNGPLVIGETQLVGSEGLSVSPRGSYVLVERDNRFHLLGSAGLQEAAVLEKPPQAKAALSLDNRHAIVVSPDESLALASYTDAAAPGARLVALNELPSGKLRVVHRIEKGESMGFASDGRAYFIASKLAVAVFDPSGKPRKELSIETALVALGAEGKLVAYTEPKAQSPIKVVDVASASVVAEWTPAEPYRFAVSSLAFSPDGARVAASGGFSGKVHVWGATTGKLLFERAPRDYQNDDILFATDGSLWSINGWGGPVGWDTQGNEVGQLVSFSLDAHSIGVGPATVAAVDSYGSLLRWDRRTNTLIPGPGLRAEASLLKFSADDKLVHAISGRRSESVASWDVASGKLARVASFRLPTDFAWFVDDVAPENNAAWALAQPKDEAGKLRLNGARPIDGGKRYLRVERNRVQLLPNGTPLEVPFYIADAAPSPDAEWVLLRGSTLSENVPFTLFNLRTGARAETHPTQPADRARWSRMGVAALWLDDGRRVTLFEPTGVSETLETPEPIDAVAFSRSGKTIAIGCRDGVVRLFDVATRHVVTDLVHPAKSIDSRRGLPALAFSNDGRRLASGNREGTVVVWDLPAE